MKYTRLVITMLLLPIGMLCGEATDSVPEVAASAAPSAQRATTPVPKTENNNWMPQHDAYVALAQKGGIDVLFIGDSLTKCWAREGREVWKARFAPMRAANFGISGDCTQHVLWRMQNGELENIQPKLVVLLIGTNNITAQDSPTDIGQAVGAMIGEIHKRSPNTRILLLGVLPRRELASHPDREIVRSVNQVLAQLQNGNTVTFLDIGDKFLQPDGSMTKEVSKDFIHLTDKGYEVFADAIQPTIESLLGKK